jgi:broad specificity phosphatase PhoE
MRSLEVRRHSLTKKGASRGVGSSLSAEGVSLARAVGAGLGPFAFVASSPVPRTLETAIAMGFAVDEILDLPSGYVPGEVEHHAQWEWPRPYARYAALIAEGRGLARAAAAARGAFARIMQSIPDGAAALVISHGGTIEPALVACCPAADHGSWGPALRHCEGARLGYEDGAFVAVELRRVARSETVTGAQVTASDDER